MLTLTFSDLREQYVPGEPVTATLKVANEGPGTQMVPELHPSYGFVEVEIRGPHDEQFSLHRPWSWDCSDPESLWRDLAPGEARYEEVKLFYDSRGWVFPDIGTYKLRATMTLKSKRKLSTETQIQVADDYGSADDEAWQLLKERDRALFLFLDGADHLTEAKSALSEFEGRKDAQKAQALHAIRLALGMAHLRPTLSVGLKKRPEPRMEQAVKVLGKNQGRIWPIADRLPPFTLLRSTRLYIDALQHFNKETIEIRDLLKQHMGHVESVQSLVNELTHETSPERIDTQRQSIR
jgi:hypothetical protein